MQAGAKSICGGNEIHVKLDRFLVPGLTSGESQQQQSTGEPSLPQESWGL